MPEPTLVSPRSPSPASEPPPSSRTPRSQDGGEPSATTVLRSLLKIWPLLALVIPTMVGLLLETRASAAAVIRLEAAMATKADVTELGHARDEVRDLMTRYQRDEDKRDAREAKLADQLATIQRDLERVCARVQCGR